MLQTTQRFIEEYINLIDDENWDELFEIAEKELHIEEQYDLIEVLQSIGCKFEVIE